MTHTLYRENLTRTLPVAVAGDGPYLIDASGKRYMDGSGGAAVSCLGHSNAAVRAAIHAQTDQLAFAHSRFFTTDAAERLADDLVDGAPANLTKVWLTCGGSESVEAALKLTRQYFVETGQSQRSYVIARRQGYHGNTFGALSASGNIWRRRPFEPVLIASMQHISPCYAYRDKRTDESPEAYGLRMANELEAKIVELGADKVAAFIAETVVGATLGAVTATPGYFKRIREICDQYGVLLILDEVMCGMGRTGTRYACEQEGIAPDLLAVAKGLGAGYQPIGAVLIAEKIHRAIERGSNVVMHGHTFTGHPVACAAALATQNEIRAHGLLANVQRQGAALTAALTERFGSHPHVGDIRGRGLFMALEFVADRRTKQPFEPALKINARIKDVGMENGLICYPAGGLVDGKSGDHVMIAPPYIVTAAHIGEIVDKLARTVDAVLRDVMVKAADVIRAHAGIQGVLTPLQPGLPPARE
jgi:adenosylmethionine-8-amino-7-oxononanoate aminotransferase